jgi:hypothetical protein
MAGIKVDYNGVQHRNTFPKRIRPKELAQAFLFPETSLTSFKCSSLRMALKNNTDDGQCRQSLCLLEKVIQGDENTKGWTEQVSPYRQSLKTNTVENYVKFGDWETMEKKLENL